MLPQTSLPNPQPLPELTPASRVNVWPHWLETWPATAFLQELKAPSKANHPIGCWDPHVIEHDSMLPVNFRLYGQFPAPKEPRKWVHCMRQLNPLTPLDWPFIWPKPGDPEFRDSPWLSGYIPDSLTLTVAELHQIATTGSLAYMKPSTGGHSTRP